MRLIFSRKISGTMYRLFYAFKTAKMEKNLRHVGKNSTLSGADIRAVLYSMIEVMQDGLEEGFIVRLGDGIFVVQVR